MNKKEFIRRLNQELSVLNSEERKEIIDFYEERFTSGMNYENKTEEEICSELESPSTIAKNVLEEYGVSPKYIHSSEERYHGVNTSRVVLLLLFDVFVATWLIPALFSIVVAIFGSLLSYFGSFGFLFGSPERYDFVLFLFLTGGYFLVFMFGLVVLDLFIYVMKKIIIWHLNVFKINKREVFIKKSAKYTIEGFFKHHSGIRFMKNILMLISIILVVSCGVYLVGNYNDVKAYYNTHEMKTDVYTKDVSQDISANDLWTITTDFDIMDIDIVRTNTNEIKVTHNYNEINDFTISIDDVTNQLNISENFDNFNWTFGFKNLFSFIGLEKNITIEIPENLQMQDIDVTTATGSIDIDGFAVNDLDLNCVTGSINASNIEVSGDATAEVTTGSITIINMDAQNSSTLNVSNVTGKIKVNDVEFGNYVIDNTTGSIYLDNFNTTSQDGLSISVDNVTGSINLSNVYVNNVSIDNVSGDINYFNNDTTFLPNSFHKETVSGDINTNVR